MKAILTTILVLGTAGFSLAGCEAANTQANNPGQTREVFVAGNGADRTVQVPASSQTATESPYAIRGSQSTTPNLATSGMIQGTNSR